MESVLFLDYTTLRVIWWALLGILLIGFAIMDGFDLGTAMGLPFIAKTDAERRVVINTVGPVWEGNQVWFILGGGAIFAAFPPLYAASFSGFYLVMFLVLCSFIIRPVGFKFRSKVGNTRWRSFWDWSLCVGGLVPTLVFGVAFGNLFQGVPFHFDDNMYVYYGDHFIKLLNPFGLLCGVVSVAMLLMHGLNYVGLKTSGSVASRARKISKIAAIVFLALYLVGGYWVYHFIDGYKIVGAAVTDGPSNPLLKNVVRETGAWMNNYEVYPWMIVAPLLTIIGALVVIFKERFAFLGSAAAIFGTISTCGLSLFPFLMPSSTDPKSSLTAWDASSSHMTLFIMLVATIIFLPIVLAYTAWVYKVMRGRVTPQSLQDNSNAY